MLTEHGIPVLCMYPHAFTSETILHAIVMLNELKLSININNSTTNNVELLGSIQKNLTVLENVLILRNRKTLTDTAFNDKPR